MIYQEEYRFLYNDVSDIEIYSLNAVGKLIIYYGGETRHGNQWYSGSWSKFNWCLQKENLEIW